MRSIIFADLSGFSALTEVHGDIDAVGIARRFKDLALAAATDQAHVLKTMGDAVMITAADPVAAARVTVQLAHLVDAEPNFPMVRIGLHHGPVVESENDCFGATVNLAARVAGHARAGQILCTNEVAAVIRNQPQLDVIEAGVVRFKNIISPIALFEIVARQEPCDVIVDPVCRMRIFDPGAASRLLHEGATYYFCSIQCIRRFLQNPDEYGGHR